MTREEDEAEAMMQPGFNQAAKMLLESIPAENPGRDGLIKTPKRFAKAMAFLLHGYEQNISEVLSPESLFEDDHQEPITVKDIDIFSFCEHHILPFYGKLHVTYIPREGKIVGLSKLVRLAEMFSRRLQVQERLTRQIADSLEEALDPLGVGVIVECTHMCMSMRGVRSVNSTTVTCVRHGCFEDDDGLWKDFMSQVFRSSSSSVAVPVESTATKKESSSSLYGSKHLPLCLGAGTSTTVCPECSGSTIQEISHSKPPRQEESFSQVEDYRLYTTCSNEEFTKMGKIIKDSCFGHILQKPDGFSMMDIGAGTGHVLKKLVSDVDVVPGRYVAYEPDAGAVKDLREVLQSRDFESISHEVKSIAFGPAVALDDSGGPFDLVLLAHCLYSLTKSQTIDIFKHALQFVAPGGVLLVFHHCKSKALDILRSYMLEENIMFYQNDYSVRVDLTSLTPNEVVRVERYTKSKSYDNKSIYRHMCILAVEPGSCRPVRGENMRLAIQDRKVSYDARSVVPGAICAPHSTVGIQACLRAAAEKGFGFDSVSVIGGGHGPNCIVADALAVDMSNWKNVTVCVEKMMVCAGGGATCRDITLAAEKEGLFTPLGDRGGVGVGLVISGGINHFMRKHGLAIDNIIQLTYVSPSGDLVVADDEDHLMRFRGAGPHFGVVLQVCLQLHSIGNISNQHAEYSFENWNASSDILRAYSEYSARLPPSSHCLDAFVFYKKDRLVLGTSLYLFGEKDEDIKCQFSDEGLPFRCLPGFESIKLSDVASNLLPSQLYDRELYMTESFSMQSATSCTGYSNHCKLRSVKRCLFFQLLQGEVESELIQSMASATKWSYYHILHGGGEVQRVPPNLTAFCTRRWEFAVVVTGRWPDGDTVLRAQATEWVKQTTQRLLPYAQGVYSTDLGPADYDMRHRAYEQQNLVLLAELKRKHDPLMLLRHSCPLTHPPSFHSIGSPTGQSRGIVISVIGTRASGKDWLGNIIQVQLKKLLGNHPQAQTNVNVVSISEGTKMAYARERGIDGSLLLRSRTLKEQHRRQLTEFYERKKVLDPAFDRKCFVDAIHEKDGILILTGMRDGFEYARLLSGRPVILVHVFADGEAKAKRCGWRNEVGIDDLEATKIDRLSPDLVYRNDCDSTAARAMSWVEKELAPAIVKSCITTIDIPKKDILYKDVGGLFAQPFGISLVTALLVKHLKSTTDIYDAVLAPEALGFTIAGSVAGRLCLPLLIARKAKPVFDSFYEAASTGSNISRLIGTSGNDEEQFLFMVSGSIVPGQRILVVDDCLATGSTLKALACLVSKQGARISKLVTLMEFPELEGRKAVEGIEVFSLTKFEGL